MSRATAAREGERGEVLVVVDDDWMAALLRGHLSHAGIEVTVAQEARRGLELAREGKPDCIVVNDELPDIDGYWLIDRVRREASAVSAVPILLLTEHLDEVRGAAVGADLLLKRPLDNEEVVAQVEALLQLARRLRGGRNPKRDSYAPTDDSRPALRGDIAQMSVTTILTVLEMERRTGVLLVEGATGSTRVARLALRGGQVVEAKLGDRKVRSIDLMRHMLRIQQGKFSFNSDDSVPEGPGDSLGMLLLESARLEDEDSV